jgi:hypothetical protein
VIHSWLLLDNKAGVIMDPTASILVGWHITVKVKGNTIWGVTAEISTLLNSGVLVIWGGSLSIVLDLTRETVLTHCNTEWVNH